MSGQQTTETKQEVKDTKPKDPSLFKTISEVDEVSAWEIQGVGCFVRVGIDTEYVPGTKISGNQIISINAN